MLVGGQLSCKDFGGCRGIFIVMRPAPIDADRAQRERKDEQADQDGGPLPPRRTNRMLRHGHIPLYPRLTKVRSLPSSGMIKTA